MKNYLFMFVLGTLVGSWCLVGCNSHDKKYSKIQPAKVETRPGERIPNVILTPEAEKRLGIETSKTEIGRSSNQKLFQVPSSSILYDETGRNWIYFSLGNQTYHRTEIRLVKIEGKSAFISIPKSIQSPVVTVGASELLGTELGVGK